MRSLSIFFLLLVLPSISCAESEAQTWLQFLSQTKVSDGFRIWGEFQPRYNFPTGKFTTAIVRPGLGWQVSSELSLWAGYAWTPQISPTMRDEHRIWAQGIYAVPLGEAILTQRLRLESRFIETVGSIAFRLRYQVRLAFPIALEKSLQLAFYDELFLALNGPVASIQSGYDQNRFFGGIFWKLSPLFAFDLGYLWNNIRRPHLNDSKNNHILMSSLYFYL